MAYQLSEPRNELSKKLLLDILKKLINYCCATDKEFKQALINADKKTTSTMIKEKMKELYNTLTGHVLFIPEEFNFKIRVRLNKSIKIKEKPSRAYKQRYSKSY